MHIQCRRPASRKERAMDKRCPFRARHCVHSARSFYVSSIYGNIPNAPRMIHAVSCIFRGHMRFGAFSRAFNRRSNSSSRVNSAAIYAAVSRGRNVAYRECWSALNTDYSAFCWATVARSSRCFFYDSCSPYLRKRGPLPICS